MQIRESFHASVLAYLRPCTPKAQRHKRFRPSSFNSVGKMVKKLASSCFGSIIVQKSCSLFVVKGNAGVLFKFAGLAGGAQVIGSQQNRASVWQCQHMSSYQLPWEGAASASPSTS